MGVRFRRPDEERKRRGHPLKKRCCGGGVRVWTSSVSFIRAPPCRGFATGGDLVEGGDTFMVVEVGEKTDGGEG